MNSAAPMKLNEVLRQVPDPNRGHWGIEIMHRNKDVLLGEDQYTNRSDNAPANVFSLTRLVLTIFKTICPSVTRAIEYFQDDKDRAIRLI
jgi:hypothetical protein